MADEKENLKLTCLRSGQPRAYADTEQVYIVEFFDETEPTREQAIERAAKAVGYTEHPFPQKQKKEFGPCFDPYLDYAKRIEKGKWEFRFVEAYTD